MKRHQTPTITIDGDGYLVTRSLGVNLHTEYIGQALASAVQSLEMYTTMHDQRPDWSTLTSRVEMDAGDHTLLVRVEPA